MRGLPVNQEQAPETTWRNYQILDEIEKNATLSQRDIAKSVGIALGMTNQIVKRLVHKGFIKTRAINAKRVAYYLTPQGFSEKIRLVMEYTRVTVSFFSTVRTLLNQAIASLQAEYTVETVAIIGTGELAEAAYLSAQESGLTLVAVLGKQRVGQKWFGKLVLDPAGASSIVADVVIQTDLDAEGMMDDDLTRLAKHKIELHALLSDGLARFAKRMNSEKYTP